MPCASCSRSHPNPECFTDNRHNHEKSLLPVIAGLRPAAVRHRLRTERPDDPDAAGLHPGRLRRALRTRTGAPHADRLLQLHEQHPHHRHRSAGPDRCRHTPRRTGRRGDRLRGQQLCHRQRADPGHPEQPGRSGLLSGHPHRARRPERLRHDYRGRPAVVEQHGRSAANLPVPVRRPDGRQSHRTDRFERQQRHLRRGGGCPTAHSRRRFPHAEPLDPLRPDGRLPPAGSRLAAGDRLLPPPQRRIAS